MYSAGIRQDGEHVERRQSLRILHQRQVDDILDRAISERGPDALVLAARFRLGGMRRPVDPDMPQALQSHGDCALARPEHRVQIHTPACDGASLDRVGSARCERRQTLLGGLQRARTDLAVGGVQLQLKGQLLPALPRVLRQQRRTGGEIRQRGGIGRRRLGALAGGQVQLCELLAFLAVT